MDSKTLEVRTGKEVGDSGRPISHIADTFTIVTQSLGGVDAERLRQMFPGIVIVEHTERKTYVK
jgi:hypothetical protein